VTDPVVTHVPERSRYELRLGDELIGLADYHRRDNRIAFTHTEVDPDRRERGLGSRLVKAALDDAERQGLDVIPLCPFVARYIEEHPEYAKLVPAD